MLRGNGSFNLINIQRVSRVSLERDSFFSAARHDATRRDLRARAKVTFLAGIITAGDYRKGQRPSTISDNRPDSREELFLRRQTSRESRVFVWILYIRYCTYMRIYIFILLIRVYIRHAFEDAGVFATSIYSDYSGARSSVDRDGNKFDKSIRSTATTTRSSLSRSACVCLCALLHGEYCTRAMQRGGIVVGFLRMIQVSEINYFVASN